MATLRAIWTMASLRMMLPIGMLHVGQVPFSTLQPMLRCFHAPFGRHYRLFEGFSHGIEVSSMF